MFGMFARQGYRPQTSSGLKLQTLRDSLLEVDLTGDSSLQNSRRASCLFRAYLHRSIRVNLASYYPSPPTRSGLFLRTVLEATCYEDATEGVFLYDRASRRLCLTGR
jgi:hypothetical protein